MIKHPNIRDRGILTGFAVPAARHFVGLVTNKNYRSYHKACTSLLLQKASNDAHLKWRGKRIHFADRESLLSNLGEIFVQEVYSFPAGEEAPYILDCGANIGLATLYWKQRFGSLNGICFEPDPRLAQLLGKNLVEWDVDVQIVNAALSAENGTASFEADGSDAGHLADDPETCCLEVNLVQLGQYMDRPIDLLKVDIEGAEFHVLRSARDKLHLVRRIFVEWHGLRNEKSSLSEMLELLESEGFRLTFREGFPADGQWHDLARGSARIVQTLNIYGVRG
jgi:FkbM family methyltransferase